MVLSSPTGVPLLYRCPGELYFAYSWSAVAPIRDRAAAQPLVRSAADAVLAVSRAIRAEISQQVAVKDGLKASRWSILFAQDGAGTQAPQAIQIRTQDRNVIFCRRPS